jgi:hypothetical protein
MSSGERERRTGIEPASSPWKGEALPLSYHRASEAAPLRGATSMTVCTNDLALCHLVEDALPIAVSESIADSELLVPEVIELEHHRIALSAIDAGVIAEVGDQIVDPLGDGCLPALSRSVDVAPPVRTVVDLLVRRTTGTAVVVPLPLRFPSPSELLKGLAHRASPTPSHACDPSYTNRRSPLGLFAMLAGVDPRSLPMRQNANSHGEWRSLVAHSAGGRAVAGSNPVSPISESPLGKRVFGVPGSIGEV